VRGEGVGEGSGVAVGSNGVGATTDAAGLAGCGAEQLTPRAIVKRTNQATSGTGRTLRIVVVQENVGSQSGIARRPTGQPDSSAAASRFPGMSISELLLEI